MKLRMPRAGTLFFLFLLVVAHPHLRAEAFQETYADLVKQFTAAVEKADEKQLSTISMKFAKLKNPAAIPLMIGAIDSDGTPATIHGLGFFGLAVMTGVQYDAKNDGRFWKGWWERNRANYPPAVRDAPIPAFKSPGGEKASISVPSASDVSHIPSNPFYAGQDKNKVYVLSGALSPVPENGFRLLVVLPGGDGKIDFHPFVKRIQANALSGNYLVAQPVPPKWSNDKIVWPNGQLKNDGQLFSTEEFIEAVIKDVQSKVKIDPKYIFTMGWSSSGPPCYSHSFLKKKSSRGAFVSMSVFKPEVMPPVDNIQGHAIYILHSPEDFIPIAMAQKARDTLRSSGATVGYDTYAGGHGWKGDVYGMIRKGIAFLESSAK